MTTLNYLVRFIRAKLVETDLVWKLVSRVFVRERIFVLIDRTLKWSLKIYSFFVNLCGFLLSFIDVLLIIPSGSDRRVVSSDPTDSESTWYRTDRTHEPHDTVNLICGIKWKDNIEPRNSGVFVTGTINPGVSFGWVKTSIYLIWETIHVSWDVRSLANLNNIFADRCILKQNDHKIGFLMKGNPFSVYGFCGGKILMWLVIRQSTFQA